MALSAPRLKYMVAMASASAQLSATTVAESNRDVTLRPSSGRSCGISYCLRRHGRNGGSCPKWQASFAHADTSGEIGAVGHIAVEGSFYADPPGNAFAADTLAAAFAADLHQIVLRAAALHEGRDQIDRIALGDRVEIELYAGIVLHEPAVPDMDAPGNLRIAGANRGSGCVPPRARQIPRHRPAA